MNTLDLDCRQWRSEHIRSYAMALAGCHLFLLLILDHETPLHTICEDSPAGVLLWAWYNCAVGLPDVAMTAVELALARWPGDVRLREMREAMSTQKEPAQ